MSSTVKYYDSHTLKIDCGAISKKNLERILGDAILPLKNQLSNLGITLDTFHELKLVVNKEGMSLGKAFLWVRDPQLYNILIGLNADGTERVKTYPDPDWVEPASPIGSNIIDFSAPVVPSHISWSDLVDEEEENTRPMITAKLPPLLQFNEYMYSEDEKLLAKQIIDIEWRKDTLLLFYNKVITGETVDWTVSEQEYNRFIAQFVEDNIPETAVAKTINRYLQSLNDTQRVDINTLFETVAENVDPDDDTPLVDSHLIVIAGAYVGNVEDTQLKHVLTAKVYPAILNQNNDQKIISKLGKLAVKNKKGEYEVKIIPDEKIMKEKFDPYTTIKKFQENKGKIIEYPIYNFNPKSNVLSMTFFDRKGRDAQFALLMNRKIEYIDPKTGLSTVLNFAQGKNFGPKF
jgi:hypothetical protein